MLTPTQKGAYLVLTAGVTWGMLCLFARQLAHYGLSSWDIAAVRVLGAMLVFSIALLRINPRAFRIRLKDLWCFAGCGVVSITMCNVCYFATMQRTTVNIAVVLLYTSPAFVALLSHLVFKERLSFYKYLALFCVLLGCCLTAGIFSGSPSTRLSFPVFMIGISSGLAYGLFSIFGRIAQKRGYSSITITLWAFIFAALSSLFYTNFHTVETAIVQHPAALCFMLGISLVSTIIPYWFYTAGLRLIQPSSAAIIVSVEPIVGTLLGICVFGESMGFAAVLGMLFILGACILCLK